MYRMPFWKKPALIVISIIVCCAAMPAASADSGKANAIAVHKIDAKTGKLSYDQYLALNANIERPKDVVIFPLETFKTADGLTAEIIDRFEGSEGKSVKTSEEGTITWDIEVPTDGMYNIDMTYYPIAGKSSAIDRTLLIDGLLPFTEAANIEFPRVWGNAKPTIDKDNQGNDLRPEQIETPIWQERVLQDSEGYYANPFMFHLTKGMHAISLKSEREPVVINQLKLFQVAEPLSYKEMEKAYNQKGYQSTSHEFIKIQAEDAAYKSSPTLFPIEDRSSPAVEPYSAAKIKINTIGGYNWRLPGQWMTWDVKVPQTGLYTIGMNEKQNVLRGLYSTRKLFIDGQVPFKEMEKIPFYYSSAWKTQVLGGDSYPYLYYLTAGTHQIKLEDTLGDVAVLIRQVESSVLKLNAMYRKVLMITGTTPDPYRDYLIEKQIPDLIETFQAESQNLNAVARKLEVIAGHHSEQEATLKTMADQLDVLIDKPEKVPKVLVSFNTNLGSLGTWIQQVREQPLQLDALYIAAPEVKIPKNDASFFAKAVHELKSFAYSFLINYSEIGNVSHNAKNKTITVWIGSGRDQAQVIKALIDEDFTPKTGINVNLKLVQMNMLLPATLTKRGPDIAMQIGNDVPVNYAMRHAVADLTQFADFTDISKRFRDSAMVPYKFGTGVYALPETQTFNMMFYRKDILEELNLTVPNTWEDIYNMLPVLDKYHLQFGLPRPVQLQAYQNPEPNAALAMFMFQNGGRFYKNGGKASDLDSEANIKSFKAWTELYTDYKLPKEFDFANRFRTGEMLIGIADYTTYNQLTVFAPEIRGLWGFVPVPGTPRPDGTLRRDVAGSGNGMVLMQDAKDKNASWEFMKWWTSAGTQTNFGREMEGILGASARYPTANIAALDSLPWQASDIRNLKEQFKWVQGIPQVPGGYFTGRHLDNAFFKVVNNTGADVSKKWYKPYVSIDDHAGPREALEDYVLYINDEITSKRKEFNLP